MTTWLSLLWRFFICFLWLVVILTLVLAFASIGKAEEPEKPKVQQIKGCVFLGWFNLTGDPAKSFFIQVIGDEDDYSDDDGNPLIHGYNPMNRHVTHKGVYIPERHRADWFVEANKFANVTDGHRSGIVKCPSY